MNLPGKAFPDFNAELFENFTWDGLALIKRDSTNFVNESAVTGGNPILAFGKDSSKVLFEDMLGSTVGSVEGGKFNAIDRSAFGESKHDDNELNFFTGKPQVEGLGYAFNLRNYRAEQGKWQTQDPIGLALMSPEFSDQANNLAYKLGYPDGWNNLAYCNNWVTSAIDWQGAATWVTVSDNGLPVPSSTSVTGASTNSADGIRWTVTVTDVGYSPTSTTTTNTSTTTRTITYVFRRSTTVTNIFHLKSDNGVESITGTTEVSRVEDQNAYTRTIYQVLE